MNRAMSTTTSDAQGVMQRTGGRAAISDADFARATGTTAEVARQWRTGREGPRDWQLQRLRDLDEVVDQAAQVVRADTIAEWLRQPVPRLQGRVPLDVIADGQHRDVLGMIGDLIYPTFS